MDRENKLAQNETLFRAVNENIEKTAVENRYAAGDLPSFVCECADTECGDLIQLSITQYEEVRANPDRFLLWPGHEVEDIENVVERFENFVVVEKIGRGRDTAEDTDPRA
jgi:hypothetical protein